MSKNVKIKGLDKLLKKLSDPDQLSKDLIDHNKGVEIDCPTCGNKVKVPTSGAICSCGQKINFQLS